VIEEPVSPFKKRFLGVIVVLSAFILIILVNYAILMLGTDSQQTSTQIQKTERGVILDRNGRILAIQSTVYNLVAWKPTIKDPAKAAQVLSPITGLPVDEIRERIATSEGASILKRRITHSQAQNIRPFLEMEDLTGIHLEEDKGRTYPNGSQLAHVLGFTGIDSTGLEGIEYALDKELREGAGTAAEGTSFGNQVMLTIDLDIQNKLESLADAALKEHNPEAVILLALDAKSADVLAWVARPHYDPNTYRMSLPEQRRNRPLAYLYEPGSVFKIFSIAGILNNGGITPTTTFNTSGGFHSPLFKDPITDLSDYGVITSEGIIVHSSNVGAAYAAMTVSDDTFLGFVRSFGFGEKTGIELPGEEKGLVKQKTAWSGRSKPTMAIGQELAVTAIQMASAATALSNEGTLLKPHVVRKILSPSGETLRTTQREAIRQVLRPDVARQMLSWMHTAAEEGTGMRSRVEGINISVKTGTAQMIDPKTGAYSKNAFIASSLAIFPTENPQLILYIVLIHPRGESIYGGRIAAPVVRDAAEFLIPHLGIKRQGDTRFVQNSQVRVNIPNLPAIKDTMPDFRGLPLRTIVPLLSQTRYPVKIDGSGWVVSQLPEPGTPVQDGMTIVLKLAER